MDANNLHSGTLDPSALSLITTPSIDENRELVTLGRDEYDPPELIMPRDVGTFDLNGRRKYNLTVTKISPEDRTIFQSVIGDDLENHAYVDLLNGEDDNLEQILGETVVMSLRLNDVELEEIKKAENLTSITEAQIFTPTIDSHKMRVVLPG